MDVLVEVANHLEAEGLGVVGETIFVNEMPDTCDEGVLIFSTGEGFKQHTNIGRYYRGAATFAVRSRTASAGNSLSQQVFDSMSFEGKQLGACRVAVSKPEALPQSFGRNEGGHIEWLLSFELHITT